MNDNDRRDDEFDWDDIGPSRVFRIAFWSIAAAFVAALAVLLFLVATAKAHEAPTGWTYGWECCNTMDCFQEITKNVEEIPEGYRVVSTGEIIPYQDKRIKRSKDEFFHRCTHGCTHGGNQDDKHSICLYVPNKGF